MNYQNLTVEIKDELLWIGFGKFEKKSMTTFTRDTLEELRHAITYAADLDQKKSVKGLVFFSHKKGVFMHKIHAKSIKMSSMIMRITISIVLIILRNLYILRKWLHVKTPIEWESRYGVNK